MDFLTETSGFISVLQNNSSKSIRKSLLNLLVPVLFIDLTVSKKNASKEIFLEFFEFFRLSVMV